MTRDNWISPDGEIVPIEDEIVRSRFVVDRSIAPVYIHGFATVRGWFRPVCRMRTRMRSRFSLWRKNPGFGRR